MTQDAAQRQTQTTVFLQQSPQAINEEKSRNAVISDQNPVWLPKKSLVKRRGDLN